jgi:hypothetical protein
VKRISYSDDFIITDDDIADALLTYATLLAKVDQSDVVKVPALDRDGRLVEASLVIGPASQLLAFPEEHAPVEMDIADTLVLLRERIARLQTPGSVPFDKDAEYDGYPDEL